MGQKTDGRTLNKDDGLSPPSRPSPRRPRAAAEAAITAPSRCCARSRRRRTHSAAEGERRRRQLLVYSKGVTHCSYSLFTKRTHTRMKRRGCEDHRCYTFPRSFPPPSTAARSTLFIYLSPSSFSPSSTVDRSSAIASISVTTAFSSLSIRSSCSTCTRTNRLNGSTSA